MDSDKTTALFIIAIIAVLVIAGCKQENNQAPDMQGQDSKGMQADEPEPAPVDRLASIPDDAVKMTPDVDAAPPRSYSDEYNDPTPLDYPVNTAGAEDSAFILPDGKTLYFFFTPDVSVPVEKQILDGVTGIYVSKRSGDSWSEPERVILQDKGKLSGDGCEFVLGNKMWFCTVREGYTGLHWATAEYDSDSQKWTDWKVDDFDPEFEVGELHITADSNTLYYHSSRSGGKGGLDIWMLKKVDGEWTDPENVGAVNSERDEGWPALSPDGKELWISRDYGLWRSLKVDGKWTEPELMFSPLAGEATIDSQGNVYFTHHFFDGDRMIEADLYVARKK